MFAKLLITFILVSILLSSSKYVYAEQTLTIGQHELLFVLAPHPDDETLSAAGLILKILENGGTVNIVSACISNSQNLVCLKKSATDTMAVPSNFLIASKSILSPVIR